VAISHTGETREVVNCLEMVRERGARTSAITSFLHSRISKHAEVLLSSATNEVKYLPDATISRFVQLAIVDILYVDLSLREFPDSAENLDRSRVAIARNKLW
jgi:DNA-binding MurR/RpiR family transcriptional regulator